MILLQELKLNNFLSHETTILNFKEIEKLLLDGKSGSGKSAITESILFALFGKGRADNRSLVRRGTKMASVSLKVSEGSKIYVITRSVSIDGKNALVVTFNDTESEKKRFLPIDKVGIKEIQAWIEEDFLKSSYELFTNSVAYPQENENSFVKATASRRKDLLLEIVRAGDFATMYEKTRSELNSRQIKFAGTANEVKNLEETVSKAEILVKGFDTYDRRYKLVSSQLETVVMIEKDLEKQINGIAQTTKQLNDKKVIKQMLEKSIISLDLQEETINKSVAEYANFNVELAKIDVQERLTLLELSKEKEQDIKTSVNAQQIVNAHMVNRPQVFDYTKEIDEINKRLIPLMKDAGKCPAGDKCPFLLPIKGQIEYLVEQLEVKAAASVEEQIRLEQWEKQKAMLPVVLDMNKLYGQLKDIRDRIEILTKSKDTLERYEKFQSESGDINDRINRLKIEKEEITLEIKSIDSEIHNLEKIIEVFDINKINVELSTSRITKQDLEGDMQEAATGMAIAAKAMQTVKEASTALITLKKGVLEAEEDMKCLELLKEAFSPRGIKAVVIDYLVPQLEERINGVLSQMSDFRIRLDTQKATVDEEGMKEGLFITVINDHQEELPFASYSGGEKVKITIAISEALASLMNQIGFRIMDENIVSLDKESTEAFVVVLEKLQKKFPQLFVISHLQEVKDIFEKKITVVKVNGTSKII